MVETGVKWASVDRRHPRSSRFPTATPNAATARTIPLLLTSCHRLHHPNAPTIANIPLYVRAAKPRHAPSTTARPSDRSERFSLFLWSLTTSCHQLILHPLHALKPVATCLLSPNPSGQLSAAPPPPPSSDLFASCTGPPSPVVSYLARRASRLPIPASRVESPSDIVPALQPCGQSERDVHLHTAELPAPGTARTARVLFSVVRFRTPPASLHIPLSLHPGRPARLTRFIPGRTARTSPDAPAPGRPAVCMQMQQMPIPDMVNHLHQVRCRRQVEFRSAGLTSPSVPSSDIMMQLGGDVSQKLGAKRCACSSYHSNLSSRSSLRSQSSISSNRGQSHRDSTTAIYYARTPAATMCSVLQRSVVHFCNLTAHVFRAAQVCDVTTSHNLNAAATNKARGDLAHGSCPAHKLCPSRQPPQSAALHTVACSARRTPQAGS
ncbi:hypothetical protein NUW54_g8305 [Trametes sanguinea]|uniref:Uncharacterized protein n=1 Tax=Trametes sanguinea TaxID=158606 RepID=A0ACC1PFM0_9APHY|nr:hypothetical protein NUW54_g8305 [Trametes sanguinea]